MSSKIDNIAKERATYLENQAAKKVIWHEIERLDAKFETHAPEEFVFEDYEPLRDAMRKASREVVMSKELCEFTLKHKHILWGFFHADLHRAWGYPVGEKK
jgi:hypothetical protein